MACEYGPMAAGALSVETAWRMGPGYAALTTLPERRQRVQTRRRRTPPLTIARSRCRFGSNRRGVTLCAWLILRPTTGPFSQISQRFAIDAYSRTDRNPYRNMG